LHRLQCEFKGDQSW